MKIQATDLEGLFVVTSDILTDPRGEFCRCYCDNKLADIMGGRRVLQVNMSRTTIRGTIRGMHFQRPPHSEMKLIRCISGKVLDVAVDLRAGSSTYLQWHAEELTPGSARMLAIPEGFAHGFQALEDNSELLYLHTAFYTPESEGGIRYDDPGINVLWPVEITEISDRDRQHPLIDSYFQGIRL